MAKVIDEEAFPSNSKAQRKQRVQKVTTGEVKQVQRRETTGRKFVDLFTSEDASSVGSYILLDVIVPAAKDLISDIMIEGVNRVLFGDSGRRVGSGRRYKSSGHTNYGRISTQGSDRYRTISTRGRRSHDFDEVVLSTRQEAEEVIDRLRMLIDSYDSATVADFYDLVGITSNFADNKWGWYDLKNASVNRSPDGYHIWLPRPVEVE